MTPILSIQIPLAIGLLLASLTKRHLLKLAEGGIAAVGCVVLLTVLGWLAALWVSLPAVNAESMRAKQTVRILDREGNELYRVVEDEDRTFLSADEIPQHVRQAIVAIEDERFYDRSCVDLRAITRAMVANATGQDIQGASTITQQLARTVYLNQEQTIKRKVRELMLACEMESAFTKDEILDLYLNWIPFGKSAYGIESAARRYFGVPASELSLAQSVVLASLPQRPTYFSPYGSHLRTEPTMPALEMLKRGMLQPEDVTTEHVRLGLLGHDVMLQSGSVVRLGGRTDQVLTTMVRLGFITEQEKIAAQEELRTVAFRQPSEDMLAPHFVLWVREKVETLREQSGKGELWDVSGLDVRTTLDPTVQAAAEQTVRDLFPGIRQKYGADNMAMVAVDRRTREVVAYVGNPDFFDDERKGKIDMARVPRQPGSSFKPFVYAAFFAQGADPQTLINDTPMQIGKISPKNYDGTFHGRITVSRALGSSRNIPAIRAFQAAGGEGPVLRLITALGMRTPAVRKQEAVEDGKNVEYGWPMALGAAEIPLTEMVQGYAALSDSGLFKPMITIDEIVDAQGATLYEAVDKGKEIQAVDPLIARQITGILADESSRPAGWWRSQLHLPSQLEAAMKTGTSNLCLKRQGRDGNCVKYGVNNVWAMGYTPDLIVGVWVGNADNRALHPRADGLNVAVPLWKDFAMEAHGVRDDASTFADAQIERPVRVIAEVGFSEVPQGLMMDLPPGVPKPRGIR